jgi:hypothetical protein
MIEEKREQGRIKHEAIEVWFAILQIPVPKLLNGFYILLGRRSTLTVLG